MSSDLVVRRLTFVDKVKGKQHFYAVDRRGDDYADGWEFLEEYPDLLHLVSKTTEDHVEQAFLRYVEPIIRDIRYTGAQSLKRWPQELVECHLWGGCAMEGDPCWNPSRNPCAMYQPGKGQKESSRIKLQELYNLWREGYVVIIVDKVS